MWTRRVQLWWQTRKIKPLLVLAALLLFLLYAAGGVDMLMEKPYSSFKYPLEVDMVQLVSDLKNGHSIELKPINEIRFDILKTRACFQEILVLIVVKSAANHFDNRNVLRRTWGSNIRFRYKNVDLVFMLGQSSDPGVNSEVDEEFRTHGDIVQASFIDSYFNNTFKTVIGLRWCHTSCKAAKFFLFVDDDYYVNINNLLKFLQPLPAESTHKFWMGHLWVNSKPDRGHWPLATKWAMPVSVYEYEYWPPFMNGGAYIMSADIVEDFQLAADYTGYLAFDDVYLGILAKKLGIEGKSNLTLFPNPTYLKIKIDQDDERLSQVIAVHRYGQVSEVEYIWHRWHSTKDKA